MVVRKQYGGEKIRWWSVNKMAVRKQDGGLKTRWRSENKITLRKKNDCLKTRWCWTLTEEIVGFSGVWVRRKQDGSEKKKHGDWETKMALKKINLPLKKRATREKNGF